MPRDASFISFITLFLSTDSNRSRSDFIQAERYTFGIGHAIFLRLSPQSEAQRRSRPTVPAIRPSSRHPSLAPISI